MSAGLGVRPAPLSFRSVGRSHCGRVRTVNEDRFIERPELGLWAVADGMGGGVDGAAAAGRVVEALAGVEPARSAFEFLTSVRGALEAANGELYAENQARGAAGMAGATVVALLAYEGHFACVWAGDSRAYRLQEGALERISHDHSLVQGLVDSGQLSALDARRHPHRNVITRAVGVEADLGLETRHAPIEAGDRFLLCSDGICGLIDDEELARVGAQEIGQAADALVDLALARGAPDNATCVLVDVLEAD